MINPAVFIGAPLYFSKICKIYPPTLNDIIGDQMFMSFKSLLTLEQEDIQDELKEKLKEGEKAPTPFEFLLVNCYYNTEFMQVAKAGFKKLLREEVHILPEERLIVIGSKEEIQSTEESEMRCLNDENFFDFQNMVRLSCGEKTVNPPEPIDPNEDPRIRRIKEKAKLRDRIKKKKGVQGQGITLDTVLVSICCMGIGITPLNIGEMSYASISELMRTYQLKEKYDLDVRSLLAGADSKKIKPKYWIRNSD